jgi:hypothetical protein
VKAFFGHISVYAELCCEECNEVIHNHLDCPICGKKYAASDNYHDLSADTPHRLECECGSVFETTDFPYDDDTTWRQVPNAALTGGEAVPSNGVVGGFDPCCGHPPKITEWRPGCYGAQCMECGGIVGDERQLDRHELMAEWNRAIRKRTANGRRVHPRPGGGLARRRDVG